MMSTEMNHEMSRFSISSMINRLSHTTAAFRATAVLVVAAILLAIASVGATHAYFTTYATAKGYIEIPMYEETEINEDFADWTKSVTISNTAPADDPASISVFVRARAFSGSTYPLTYTSDGSWTLGDDGYYYCSKPLAPGETTPKLDVRINGVPEDEADIDSFNVVIVYETTPVLYRADGTPYADWTDILDNGNLAGGDVQ